MLEWFTSTTGGRITHTEFEKQAALIAPGATGLLALDWWNGNRTILADADLGGVILGMSLQSSLPEIYRALLEAIAFGNRRIMDNFEEHGIRLTEIVACGGIAEKSPLMMQLLADTSGRRVSVPSTPDVPARGSALYGAVAAGVFPDIGAAVRATETRNAQLYEPNPTAVGTYERIYAIYREVYDTLGSSRAEWLHGLKQIKREAFQR